MYIKESSVKFSLLRKIYAKYIRLMHVIVTVFFFFFTIETYFDVHNLQVFDRQDIYHSLYVHKVS